MTALQRTALGIAAALLIALALLLPAALANAQEPPEAGTRLEPGVNLVGWVGEATPVSQLFDEIPQLEAVWAWDAELRDWIVAGRGAPEWLGGLDRVTAGMGLRMYLGGDQPYLWQRSTEPTRGLVKLRTGWNLVAWSGADQTPIDDAVKGIGWSLRTVRRWNPATQQWAVWTSPERSAQLIVAANTDQEDDDSQTPAIRRGEALWINVARVVNWLQPTDILPRLVFPGGASDELQARVRQDLEAVLAFFRDQYGIQADPDFTIYAAKDVDALIQAYKDDGQDVDDAYEASQRALWNRASGWAGGNIVVKQSSWPDDLSTDEIAWARYTITHEYFHILQRQLSDSWASQWLVEGTADWVEDEHAVLDGKQTRDDLHDLLSSAITSDTPTLRSAESDNTRWQYTLGQLATDRLTADGGPDFLIEFWHRLAPTEIGPHGRWMSTLDWRTALQQVSGQTTSEFYAEFDAWQREQAATNAATADSYEYDGNWIRGQVTGDDGAPVAGLFVNAIRVEGETSVGWNQRAETDADGSFAVQAPVDGDYRLSVDINDDCTRYYSDGQLINDGEQWDDWKEARPVKVSQSDVSGIDIRLPPNVCVWQIRGHLVGPNAEPLAGIRVSACPTGGGGQCHSSASVIDGSFAVTVDESGENHLHADLGHGCSVSYDIEISNEDVHLGLLRVPEGTCAYQIKGRIIQPDGQPLADTRVCAYIGSARNCPSGDTGSVDRMVMVDARDDGDWGNDARTDSGGSFAITVPVEGHYSLSFEFDGCTVHFGSYDFSIAPSEAMTVHVQGGDAHLTSRQIPSGVCGDQIKGNITQADGGPLAHTSVVACLEVDGDCDGDWLFTWTDDGGAFAITVPAEGRYRVWINLEGCRVYFRSDGLTTTYSERSTVHVEGRDVHIASRKIPANVCAHRISGQFVDSSGTPLAGRYLDLYRTDSGWVGGASTDTNGRFRFRLPSDGTYYFRGIWITRGCNHRLDDDSVGGRNNPIRVQGADVTGIILRLPGTIEELCK